MKPLVGIAAAALALAATAPSARADMWAGPFGFDVPYQASGNGAYTVAGMGDGNLGRPLRYWGGTHWVDCGGYHPPYDSTDDRGRLCRHHHPRRLKVLHVRG